MSRFGTDQLVVDDVVVSYRDQTVLTETSFAIPSGQTVAIIGPNGSGKTTLLNLIAGLKTPDSGTVRLGGKSPQAAQSEISYVFQGNRVNETLPVTVEEVVRMGRYRQSGWWGRIGSAEQKEISAVMELMEIGHLRRSHLKNLSGGQRQRVFVAQGLVQDHRYLLLDEPTTGLDLVSAGLIDQIITGDIKREGGMVIFTTHDLRQAQLADWVVLLAGRCVCCGSPEEAIIPENLKQAYQHQFVISEGQLHLDDAAHSPAGERHVHQDRSIHLELPGSEIHSD